MSDNPLVSVLIPAYNHENYVQETIKSIIDQTYKNIELIVVDDGSKDSTWQKIQEMRGKCEERFTRVHFDTKENEGTCATLNKLLALSKGEYVYIIASDDIAKPNAIEKEANFLNNNPEYALVVGDNELIDSNGKVCYWDKNRNMVYSKKDAKYLTFGGFLQKHKKFNFLSEDFGTYKTLYLENYIPNGYLIRKDIFNKTGYFTPEAPLEDYYLMLQISKYAKMKYLDEILFSYRWHDCNTIKDSSKMDLYSNKTKKYEEQILKNLTEEDLSQDVYTVKKYGACYKKQGIPFVFQILKYIKGDKKYSLIKIFGILIFQWEKRK